jgi:hypothetical protein
LQQPSIFVIGEVDIRQDTLLLLRLNGGVILPRRWIDRVEFVVCRRLLIFASRLRNGVVASAV